MGPVDEDPRWDIFIDFHAYLKSAFPKVYAGCQSASNGFPTDSLFAIASHSTMELTKVNTYGLIFKIEGSDSSLKPLLLMGHQGGLDEHVFGLRRRN